ncbi:TPA: molecular chaperone, partial [Klebsiella pneumoniae]
MRILNSLLSIILLLSASFACYAGVQVGTTRIIYAEGKKEVSVSLDNQDITPYLIKSW